MLTEDKARVEKRELAPLKEKISQFLYNNYIDFERDKGIVIDGEEYYPAFFLNKHNIIIDCVRMAGVGNPDYDKKHKAYTEDGVKHLFLDMGNLLSKNVEETLNAKLPGLGCNL